PEHDIATAVATLAELGFRCKRHNAWLKPYLAFGHELDFIRDTGDVCVDLQWRLGKRWLSLPVNSSEVWNRAQSTTISGYRVSQLSAEDAILFLCTHGYRHCWSRLIWIMDVAAFLHRFETQLDGIRLLKQGRAHGGMRLLTLGLWLAHEIGGAPLPASLQRLIPWPP